jgi:hypothetical protein
MSLVVFDNVKSFLLRKGVVNIMPNAKGGNFRAHIFKADCMNYEKSFRGATQKAATDKAVGYIKRELLIEGDEDAYIVFEGTGILVAEVEPEDRPVIVRPVKPDDDNGITIGRD